jgi:hypothetical protein
MIRLMPDFVKGTDELVPVFNYKLMLGDIWGSGNIASCILNPYNS